jgi:hypothetical protein
MTKNPTDHLPPYRVRPRFQIASTLSPQEVTDKLRAALQAADAPCKGQVNLGYATFYLPKAEQHYWSPQVTITFEENENGTLICGLYGPRPAVWTMFVFFYGIIAFIIMVILIIGYSHLSLGSETWIFYWIPVLVLVFLSLYFVAYSGQQLGRDQMLILHGFLEENLGVSR